MSNKKNLGQFFTKNYDYILQSLYIPENTSTIVEPFCGEGDMLKFIKNREKYKIECYDIEPKNEDITKCDTLLNPPSYKDKFIITNPPYLARNKCKNKTIFDKYDVNDLYKCFLLNLTENICLGGIIIIPLNFWSSIRKMDIELRQKFLDIYDVLHINIFEEQVFSDTSYAVSSFQFSLKKSEINMIKIMIYPSKKEMNVLLNKENNYIIGGEIYFIDTKNSKYTVSRLIRGDKKNTNILVKCIDDNIDNKICMKIVKDNEVFYDDTPKKSARTYATLCIDPPINDLQQEKLVKDFNEYLYNFREKYNSLFMANYRESNTIARKRISFDLIYKIVEHLLNTF